MGGTRSSIAKLLAAGVAAGLVLVAHVSPASAQDCGPYGCEPIPPQPGVVVEPTCTLSDTSAEAGTTVRADIGNVPIGTTVELRVAGSAVGSQTATTPRAGSDPPVADLSFTFDAPAAAGVYEVAGIGPGFQAVCSGGLQVLGSQLTRQPTNPGGSGGGSLVRTGLEAGVLLAVAVALIMVGRWFYGASRRRRDTVAALQLASGRTPTDNTP